MLKGLKQRVLRANLELARRGLVIYTWGNVSGIDRQRGLVAIKPSGVEYEKMRLEDLVVLELATGKIVEGRCRPSSDTPTHLRLYQAFPTIGGIAHTHSSWATVWAQAGRGIHCFGTTHADYFYGEIPCTRVLTEEEVEGEYERETGNAIVETFQNIDPLGMPAVLVAYHAPFTWGTDPEQAVYNSVVLEEVAKMAFATVTISSLRCPAPQYMQDRHYFRKHGPAAYYGQS